MRLLPMRPGLVASLTLLLLPLSASGQPDSDTSPTLTLVAADWEGVPLEKIPFDVRLSHGRNASGMTDRVGSLTVDLEDALTTAQIRLAGEQHWAANLPRQTIGAGVEFLTLYPADLASMQGELRESFVREYVRDYMRILASGEGLTAQEMPLRLLNLPGSSPNGGTLPEGNGALSLRVLNALGQAAPNLLVRLYTFDKAGQVTLAGYERTDASGLVVFDALPEEAHYRAVTERGPRGEQGYSSIRWLAPGEPAVLPPVVLRERGEALRGVVLDPAGGGAKGWNITVLSDSGGPALTVRTDDAGYFEASPLVPGTATIRIATDAPPLAEQHPIAFQLPLDGRELAIPLHRISSPPNSTPAN